MHSKETKMCRETATLSVAPASRREVNYPFAGALRFSHFRKCATKLICIFTIVLRMWKIVRDALTDFGIHFLRAKARLHCPDSQSIFVEIDNYL